MKKLFQDRTAGFYVALAAGVMALLSAAAYLITDFGDPTFSLVSLVLLLAAGVLQMVLPAVDFPPLMLLPVALLAAACGFHIYAAVPSITDVLNGINLYNGNGILGIVFTAAFVLTALLAAVACFMKQRKQVA